MSTLPLFSAIPAKTLLDEVEAPLERNQAKAFVVEQRVNSIPKNMFGTPQRVGGKTMTDFIVKKAVSDWAHKRKPKLNVSGATYKELNKHIGALLKAAAERAEANKRKTIMAYDL